MTDPRATILCPYCQRQFASGTSLRDHMRAKRRSSAAHGLTDDGTPRPRKEIDSAINRSMLDHDEREAARQYEREDGDV